MTYSYNTVIYVVSFLATVLNYWSSYIAMASHYHLANSFPGLAVIVAICEHFNNVL